MKTQGRKMYSVSELYWILFNMFRSAKFLVKGRKNNSISQHLSERVMLAVTEVNGCPMCSYAHTQMALEAGMTSGEIEEMLSGTIDNIPQEELPAIMFAQHYAESRGKPSPETWARIITLYGEETAKAILGAIRIIMAGNAMGAPFGSFLNRFRGKPSDPRSSIPHEIAIMVSLLVFIPATLIHSFIYGLFFHQNLI